MTVITVTSPAQLAAAVQAAAMPTHEAARGHPIYIQFETCTYRFPFGIHQRRADEIVREIKKVYRKTRPRL